MIITLTWKELREHRSIWLTMVVMTIVMVFGMTRIIAAGDPAMSLGLGALTVLGMGAAYGVVCGAMMLAGEHEGGTLVFLDIFHGRRHWLWLGKFAVGALLAPIEALAVAIVMCLIKQSPPSWGMALVGNLGDFVGVQRGGFGTGPELWLLVLPVVTLEAFAWGMFGSAVTRRVLAGAAIAAVGATPIWMTLLCLPPPAFLVLRILAAGAVLAISATHFVMQTREQSVGTRPEPEAEPVRDRRRRFLELAERYDEEDMYVDDPMPVLQRANGVPVVLPATADHVDTPLAPAAPPPKRRRSREFSEARSVAEVLWWLTLRQGWMVFAILAAVSIFVGMLMPFQGQALWPLATLLLGVACGTATFAPEQRDLAYQFLAAQHFPLRAIWRFKITFWSVAALLLVLFAILGALLAVIARLVTRPAAPQPGGLAAAFTFGTLHELMGSVLFFTVWLVYGFCSGQAVVWYCRKNVLALLLSVLVSAMSLGLWFPSLLCRGMGGWQLWLPPLVMLGGTYFLMRAWAGGRIKERQPVYALFGCTLAIVVWVALNLGYRVVEVPNVGPPLDIVAYKESIPSGNENLAGRKIEEAAALVDKANDSLKLLAEAAQFPVGVIEAPRGDGGAAAMRHLPACEKLTGRLRVEARTSPPDLALDHLTHLLALSRNLRNMAPPASYRAGVASEASALDGLDELLERGKPAPALLRRALENLNRHAAEVPPPSSSLCAECYRSSGLVLNPTVWAFNAGRGAERIPERWVARGVTLSLELPWEEERRLRLWQVVWAGLLRAGETPYWQLPDTQPELPGVKVLTRRIVSDWLADPDGLGLTHERLARLLDASWLSDEERLFTPVASLRSPANRSHWRVETARLRIALGLYQLEEAKPAPRLEDLVPKYLAKLPVDPYSGQSFRYRVSPGEQIEGLGNVLPGQAILWSTGPDRIDHGARQDGFRFADDDSRWTRGGVDLVALGIGAVR